jgi:hypothetical protein
MIQFHCDGGEALAMLRRPSFSHASVSFGAMQFFVSSRLPTAS